MKEGKEVGMKQRLVQMVMLSAVQHHTKGGREEGSKELI